MNVAELLRIGLKPRVAFAVWVTALVILLLPLPFLELDESINRYASAIKVVGIFAFIYWLVEAVLIWWEGRRQIASERTATEAVQQEVLDYLETLNANEKYILAVYLARHQQTVRWRRDLEEVESLLSKGLINAVPSVSTMGNAPYTMPRFVWNHLQQVKDRFIDNARMASPDNARRLADDV